MSVITDITHSSQSDPINLVTAMKNLRYQVDRTARNQADDAKSVRCQLSRILSVGDCPTAPKIENDDS
ncbi:hypothetical protein QUB47_13850 [Microcoleus sp. AT9_B5]